MVSSSACSTRSRASEPCRSRWWGADMKQRRLSPEPITKVNVTPIIDVALVLVIILLVTAPMMSVADLPVRLPQATTREAENERNISMTLGSDGALALDDQLVNEPELRARLSARL